MLLLALDTSTRQASLALCSENELYGEYTWQIGNNHSVELLERIRDLLSECQIAMPQIDAMAVAIGPGSFNGVRVALATAKALTFALKKTLIGVSTLDLIAAQQKQWGGPICAVLEAGRSELYAACYLFEEIYKSDGDITYFVKQRSEYFLCTPQHLALSLQEQTSDWFEGTDKSQLPPFLFCGEISSATRQALHAQMQERSLFVGNTQAARHASVLAMLALQRLHEGQRDDPLLLEPLYLRRPSITTSVRKQPLLGGVVTGQVDLSAGVSMGDSHSRE